MPLKNKQTSSRNTLLTIALIIIIILSIIIVVYTTFTTPTNEDTHDNIDQQTETPPTKEAPPVLTIRHQDDAIVYTQAQLKNMPSIRGYGGYRTSFPIIKGQGNYTGIPITYLLKPMTQNLTTYIITIYAEDGYTTNYTYEEIQGNILLYDWTNASNAEPIAIGGVTMILAYQFEDQPLDVEIDGRFKIAFINGTDTVTSSKYWAKFVTEIEIYTE
jgi:hypothetical protein